MIVALEGIDASGKRTQTEQLYRYFTEQCNAFNTVVTHDFPHYSTHAGGVVGRVLRGETVVLSEEQVACGLSVEQQRQQWSHDKGFIIQSLMITDRLEHQLLLDRFAERTDTLLILDRYLYSGVVYGAADGLPLQWLYDVQAVLIPADLNIYIDIPVEESMRRRPERRDYYERNLDKLAAVREQYVRAFTEDEDCVIVEGLKEVPELVHDIAQAVLERRQELLRLAP